MNICRRRKWPSSDFKRYLLFRLSQLSYAFLLFFNLCYTTKVNARRQSTNGRTTALGCQFPEAERTGGGGFFFDLDSGTPAEFVVVETAVQPADARIELLDIRSNNIHDIDFLEHFEIASRPASGRILLVTTAPLQIPNYPSSTNETLLYMTVACNGRQYPLITIRIVAQNRHLPEFFGGPYEIVLPKNSELGAQYATDVLAMDKDPASSYPIRFVIESGAHGDLSLVAKQRLAPLDASMRDALQCNGYAQAGDWPPAQWPHVLRLCVLRRLSRTVYYLNISATDSGSPILQKSYIQLKVLVKSVEEMTAKFSDSIYYANFTKTLAIGSDLIPNRQILATFPNRPSANVVYGLFGVSPSADRFDIDASTARLRVRLPLAELEELPATGLNLQIRAHPEGWPSETITATLTLTDVTELHLTYFAQCQYESHLLENPSTYTRVMQFNVKGDVDGVDLLNGTDLFEVNGDGTMLVRFGVDIDREKVERIVVQARLRTSAPVHPKSVELCQTATVVIIVDDFNDHTPRFDEPIYRFYVDQRPYNNTEVGTIRATDDDKGEFGRVRYRILEDELSPFVLFQANGAATIYYSLQNGAQLNSGEQRSYAFIVEAYDADKDPRTSRVSVTVILESEEEARERQNNAAAQKLSATVATVAHDRDAFQLYPLNNAVTRLGAAVRAHHSKRLEFSAPPRSMEIKQTDTFEDFAEQITTTTTKTTAITIVTERPTTTTTVAKRKFLKNTVFLKQLDLASAAAKNRSKNKMKITSGSPIKNATETVENEIDQLITMAAAAVETIAEKNATYSMRFEWEHYNFSLKGRLEYGDYIGIVMVQKPLFDCKLESQIVNNDGTTIITEDVNAVEYIVEEGIVGFVAIDAITGRLTVDRRLIEDSFEEIRFTVSAQNLRGDILVGVLGN